MRTPSPESRALRATFLSNPDAAIPDPIVERQEWEAAVASVVLPPQITVTPVETAGLRAEWIATAQADPERVLYFLHGGGYTAGSCATHRELAANLCLATGVRVLLLEYRLAPENPFPAAVDDALTGYQWLLSAGFQPENIAIAGDSAGGGLAVAALLHIRNQQLPLPAAGALLSPWLDLALTGTTLTTHSERDPMVTYQGLQSAALCYAGSTARSHPLLSPLNADLSGLPPLLVHVGSDEILLSDATRLAEKIQASGGTVTLEIWEGMWHVWHAFPIPESHEAIASIGQYVRDALLPATKIL